IKRSNRIRPECRCREPADIRHTRLPKLGGSCGENRKSDVSEEERQPNDKGSAAWDQKCAAFKRARRDGLFPTQQIWRKPGGELTDGPCEKQKRADVSQSCYLLFHG
ncbi:MAG: hypothetical protein AAFY81_10455, partial [Pseudomonadota bacterium]